ncbi:MAG: hypothetical protein IID06_02530 [Gemmatimonadetes bacterium]|nr:hypothetical protein [Gemmatimonadota bacterium]
MQRGIRFALLGGLAAGAVLSCEQSITAPGACPEFCPIGEIQLIDTVLVGVLERDTSFSGYVEPGVATAMQVVGGGAAVESHGLIWFAPFADSAAIDSVTLGLVVQQDSFQLSLVILGRSPDVTGLEITVHRISPSVDREGDFATLAPFFEDSTIVAVVAIPDDVSEDTVTTIIRIDAFPEFEAGDRQIALGLSIRGGTPAFASLNTRESALGALLTRFVLVEAGGDSLLERRDLRSPEFDGFVDTDLPSPLAGSLLIGGTPSSRTFVRVALPSFIMDSSNIVRAHLLLVPVEPVLGAPSDTFEVVAEALGADFGAKSPILSLPDSLLVAAEVGVGTTDTVVIDISRIVAFWQATPDQVRTLVLRFVDEAVSVAELRVGSTRFLGSEPMLRVTYVPPFGFGR